MDGGEVMGNSGTNVYYELCTFFSFSFSLIAFNLRHDFEGTASVFRFMQKKFADLDFVIWNIRISGSVEECTCGVIRYAYWLDL